MYVHLRASLTMPQAIVLGPNEFSIYDSRAAVFEKLGRVKDALRDSKKVIDLGPQRWQVRECNINLQQNDLILSYFSTAGVCPLCTSIPQDQ